MHADTYLTVADDLTKRIDTGANGSWSDRRIRQAA
jgi:hypothetical protein